MKNWYPLPILLMLAGCAKQEPPAPQPVVPPPHIAMQSTPPPRPPGAPLQVGRPPSPALTKRAQPGAGFFKPDNRLHLSPFIQVPATRGSLTEEQYKYFKNVALVVKAYDKESAYIGMPFLSPRTRQIEAAIREAARLHNRIEKPTARHADYHWKAAEGLSIALDSFDQYRAALRVKNTTQQAAAENRAGSEFHRGINQFIQAVKMFGQGFY